MTPTEPSPRFSDPKSLGTYPKALWWSAMQMTNMGSAYSAKTGVGRVLCLGIPIYSATMFGYLTALFATGLVSQKSIQDIQKKIVRLRASVDGVFRHGSARDIHLLRLATRKARADLWTLEKSSQSFHAEELVRHMRKLGQSLGKVRELDVAIEDARKFRITAPSLGSYRKSARGKLRKSLNPTRSAQGLHALVGVKQFLGAFAEGITMTANKSLSKRPTANNNIHLHKDHQHGETCGCKMVRHGSHVDYVHDGHGHRIHGNVVDGRNSSVPGQKKKGA